MNIGAAIEALYDLKTGVIAADSGRHERPHKPVLLLAVFDALSAGKARPNRVEWSQWLRERFSLYFDDVRSHNDDCTPENPFFYLRSDGFWVPIVVTPEGEQSLASTPTARELDTGHVFARFVEGWEVLVADAACRMQLRDALISRYFPTARSKLIAHFIEAEASIGNAGRSFPEDSSEEAQMGRSAGFRRRVTEIYDYQCVACGLRIWIPPLELSFVDAAHLVPFSETRNDHPTNGLALCKNHHWALDRKLIAPDPDAVWRISCRVEPRRSKGEEELARLEGHRLLAPVESAFAPDQRGLEWRFRQLLK